MPSQKISNMSMLDLFRMEVEGQCQTMTNELAVLANNPNSIECVNSILRAVHSIKGAASIIDIQPIVALTKSAERVLSRDNLSIGDSPEFLPCLNNLVIFLQELSQQTNEAFTPWLNAHKIQTRNLIQTIASFEITTEAHQNTESYESAPSAPAPDLSMFSIFKDDAKGHSRLLSDNLLQLEARPNDLRAIESSMRSTHSIKGAARVIGLMQIVELTHAMEELFMTAQNEKIVLRTTHIDMLLAALDFLKDLITADEANLSAWLENNKKRSCQLIKTLESAARKSIPVTPDILEQQGEELSSEETSNRQTRKSKPRSTEKSEFYPIPDSDNFIKVSTSGLNRLMGLTGEMLAEAKWQPTLLEKSIAVKRKIDSLFKEIDAVRKRFHESHFDLQIEESFKLLHKQDLLCRGLITSFITEVEEHASSANEISHRLHKEVINNRMQPFSEGINEIPRMVRDMAKDLGKDIALEIDGIETLVDRDILDLIKSPITHLISNAIDHGIETQAERKRAGKPNKATLRLEAKHHFGVLQITIADDGQGIDIENLRKVIIARKLVSEEIAQELLENELLDFLFLPNFSTRRSANHISGRGVGLDVVQSTIREIRGSVNISTIEGVGTIFELQLPLTLSVSKCLNVLINNEVYAFPLVRINHVTRITANEIMEMGGHQYFTHNSKRIGLISAQQALDLTEPENNREVYELIILQNVSKSYGIIVDKILGVRDLMVQPLTSRLGKLRSVSAASIGENGTPILILDTQDLIQSMDHLISGNRLHNIDSTGHIISKESAKTILVVDDSATVREVERKLLTSDGYEVTTAIDGVDGWQKAKKQRFNLIITDIDMPNMDGIELVLQIKDDDRFESTPIIIVSYKNREEDRNRGLEAGADYYLTKGSFQDQTLLDAVNDLIGSAHEKYVNIRQRLPGKRSGCLT